MTDNSYFDRLPFDRYGRSMRLLIISFINFQNNKDIQESYFEFGVPELFGTDGLVKLPVKFSEESNWDTSTTQYLEYKRQALIDIIPNHQFTVHIPIDQVENGSVVGALFDQYGLYLDPDTYALTEIDSNGIEIDPVDPPTGDDRWFRLTMLPNHFLLEGSIRIRVVASIVALGTTISRLLDLRQHYVNVNAGTFPTEMYVKQLTMSASIEDGQRLYYVGRETYPALDLAPVLRSLTGDNWISSPDPSAFNSAGYTVIYNGLRSDEHHSTDATYPYVLVIQLSPELCTNLQGTLSIAYRNDRKQHPGYVGGYTTRPVPVFNQ